ncbi:hypothetical protein F2P81_022624 [Scophthalmus maximus]|uniref:Uncharacterized protein n=1 Tax=Scophthalmus maximus TaxID=52904 RepID=A0A6A4RUR4_SCOMX|nr:hypothetical protein F2P81_022624 [Scophthalmus maximus]
MTHFASMSPFKMNVTARPLNGTTHIRHTALQKVSAFGAESLIFFRANVSDSPRLPVATFFVEMAEGEIRCVALSFFARVRKSAAKVKFRREISAPGAPATPRQWSGRCCRDIVTSPCCGRA